jgi:hypothetical protein
LYYTNDFTVFLLTRATQLEATRQRLEEQAHKYLAAQTHEVNIMRIHSRDPMTE